MKILNEPFWNSPYLKGKDLQFELVKVMEEISWKYSDFKENSVRYRALSSSEEYKQLFRITHALHAFELEHVEGDDRSAFWLNLYNALAANIIVETGAKSGPMELEGFFQEYRYNVGGQYFSLDDIEHGIIRANAPKYMAISAVFSPNDPRLQYAMKRVDPRVHFSFACGAKSSPSLRAFTGEHLESELNRAIQEYLDRIIELDSSNNTLAIPKLFHWYKKDFGENEDILNFIVMYMSPSKVREYMVANMADITLLFLEYDWSLNSGN